MELLLITRILTARLVYTTPEIKPSMKCYSKKLEHQLRNKARAKFHRHTQGCDQFNQALILQITAKIKVE